MSNFIKSVLMLFFIYYSVLAQNSPDDLKSYDNHKYNSEASLNMKNHSIRRMPVEDRVTLKDLHEEQYYRVHRKYETNDLLKNVQEVRIKTGYKSPTKAFILSAVIPGVGQFYTKQIWKGIGHLILYSISP